MKNCSTFLYVYLLFATFLTGPAHSAIQFSNHYWSTTFDCPDWIHDYPSSLHCDGVSSNLNNCAGTGVVPYEGTDQSRGESILASSNHEDGTPGTAAQVHYFYTGLDGLDANNNTSGGLALQLPQIVQEYWLRIYSYYPKEMG